MKKYIKEVLVVISSILLIFLSMPFERPGANLDGPRSEFTSEPGYSLLSDNLEDDVIVN